LVLELVVAKALALEEAKGLEWEQQKASVKVEGLASG
jgi:hypothetical protein